MSTNRSGAAVRLRRRPANDGLLIVGLVGQAGSGKSTVARAFAARGAHVIEADQVGHEVTDRDPEVREALIAEYGTGVYRADGTLDRARVASRVFSDRASLQRLNQLVHPRIVERIRRRIAELRADGTQGVVVVDAALMLDWGFQRECDVLLAVTAAGSEQLARLERSRGWSRAEAAARLAAQPSREEYEAAADERIENSGSEADLQKQLAAVWQRLVLRLSGRC
ncbi:MAG TPA: dephospho-CoA kinase [Candidatus Sulfotelmatobacter sp.]|nr:dephospho-CoA kinase [Candidatus Sulfotelmatobacter sp.]